MAGLLSTFGPNPLNTPVGQKIEQATDASLPAENWALNMEICDMINTSEDACKDAVKAIRKRLQQNMGKNYTVVLYTLTVLETCVKNCGRRFHLLITQKDFIMDLVKLIGPKNDPPLAIQDRILGLIQSWADAFQSVPDMQGVVQAYQDLKQKGIEFPMTDLDSMAPILTPQKSVTSSPTVPKGPINPPQPSEVSKQPSSASATVESATSKSSSTGLSQEQLVKIRSELDIVQCNMKVFGEMLTELTPGHEHSEDLQLLQDLHKTLVAMQNRIVELIDRVGVEEVTGELLHINDELNNLFLRYERYEKKQKAVQGSAEGLLLASKDVPKEAVDEPKVSSVVDQAPPSSQASADAPLIDFGDFTDVAAEGTVTGIQKLSVADGDAKKKPSGEGEAAAAAAAATSIVDEFDMFAQSRNVSYEAAKTRGSSYADNTNLEHLDEGLAFYAQRKGQSALRDDDVQNISRWLDDKPSANSNDEDFVPNPEFDKFLAERAAAAERLPDVTPKTTESSGVSLAPPPPSTGRRQADKSSAESSLFNL